MSDYVYDNGSTPDGKSDAVPLSVPANKGITAAEWNTAMQALKDLRSAITRGQYHGLVDTAAAVSGSGTARVRSVSGRVQVSENARAYRNLMPANQVHVADYGAVGDGTTNDAAAIQAALNDANARGAVLVFDAKTYKVNTELTFPDGHTVVKGTPKVLGGTLIKAGASIRSIFNLAKVTASSIVVSLQDLGFDGNRSATYCLRLCGCAFSEFKNIAVGGSLSDGVALVNLSGSNNDNNVWENLSTGGCGKLFITSALNTAESSLYGIFTTFGVTVITAGTCDFYSGSVNIDFSGAPDLTTLGLRVGDPVRVGTGSNKRFGVLSSVASSTRLIVSFDTASGLSDISASGQDFAIGCGDGYREDRSGDNNVGTFYGGAHRGNAGYAMAFDGLYGPQVLGRPNIDFHPAWFIRVGSSGSDPVLTSVFDNCYFETNGTNRPFLIISGQMCEIRNPLDFGGDASANVSYCGTSANVSGTYLNANGLQPIGAGILNRLPSTVLGQPFLAGAVLDGPLKVNSGVIAVSGTNLPRNDNSTSGAMIISVDPTGSPSINTIAAADSTKAELLILNVFGTGTVTLNHGTYLKLATATFAMTQAGHESIALVHVGGGTWVELSRSNGTGTSGTNTGDVTLTAVGSSPNADAASLSGQALTLQPADGSNPGLISTGAQTIAGAKTFSAALKAFSLAVNSGQILDFAPGVDANCYAYRSATDTIRTPANLNVGSDLVAEYRVKVSSGDSTGSPGDATINKSAGTSAVAATNTTCVITSNRIASGAMIFITPIDTDAGFAAGFKAVTAGGGGSFTLTLGAAAVGNPKFSWLVINPF